MKDIIVVRGGGDLATGVVHKLWSMKKEILILETEQPAAIRRLVAFSEAIYDGETEVEQVKAIRVNCSIDKDELAKALEDIWSKNAIPIMVDPQGVSIGLLEPAVVVDAIIAKRNLGTSMNMAPLTIALGPGFVAGDDVNYVVETMRGPDLGSIIEEGPAMANTGIPGVIQGFDKERVIHSPCAGVLRNVKQIGDLVKQGEVIAYIEKVSNTQSACVEGRQDVNTVEVYGTIDGVLRGLIRDRYPVTKGFKIADIDPRLDQKECCDQITDKARRLGESVASLIS